MMMKSLLALCVLAALVIAAVAEPAPAVTALKEQVAAGAAPAPCDKNAAPLPPAGPAPPRQFLDQRLPHVVDDYHPPAGGFNPTDIPSKEVDVAARKILRKIQAAEAEAKANGDAPPGSENAGSTDGVLSTEEHKALKQLLLDSDILVRAAAKALAENGPIEEAAVKKVAASAVNKAASLEKKADAGKKDEKKPGDKKAANKPIAKVQKKAAAAAAGAKKPAAPAAAKPAAPAPAAKPAAPAAAKPAAAAAKPAAAPAAKPAAPAAAPAKPAAAPAAKPATPAPAAAAAGAKPAAPAPAAAPAKKL